MVYESRCCANFFLKVALEAVELLLVEELYKVFLCLSRVAEPGVCVEIPLLWL